MNFDKLEEVFSEDVLKEIFPPQRTDDFFEALFGDAEEGSYDIVLRYKGHDKDRFKLLFHLELHERPGSCLACNLTYGLPEVFSRHPVLNINGVVAEVEKKLNGDVHCQSWKLGHTIPSGKSMHVIPLDIILSE